MQSKTFKSDSVDFNLDLNAANSDSDTIQNQLSAQILDPYDPAFSDSLSSVYIAPDSVIAFGAKPEWSQYRRAFIPKFDYQKDLVRPLPYDSLHTVLKGVEVVFPGKKIQRTNPDWLIGVLILSFLLFATVKLIFNKYLSQLVQSATNYSTFTRLFRERYFNLLHASFRLDIIFNLILALFVYQVITISKINFGLSQSAYVYLVCLGLVIGYFIAKRFLYFLIGVLTESYPEIQEYLFSITAYNRILGLFLLPVSAAIAFIPLSQVKQLQYLGIAIIAIFYILSLFRGAKIFLKKQFSIS